MGAVQAKGIEADYKVDPLMGFENGRKPRGKFLVSYLKICTIRSSHLMFHCEWFSNLDVADCNLIIVYETEIQASQTDMESAKIPLDKRDYCVDYLLKYMGCRADVFPFLYKCHHEKHEYLHCQYEEWVLIIASNSTYKTNYSFCPQSYIIRMKEFEREKRLAERPVVPAEDEE